MSAIATEVRTKIWANSGDSHFLEPEDLWEKNLPPRLAELTPRSVKDPDGLHETVHVDGQSFRRALPNPKQAEFYAATNRPPGVANIGLRLADLDQEGIWTELVFPSLGMWNASFRTPELVRECMRISNDWAKAEIMDATPRLMPAAQVSVLSVEDAVAELRRCAGMGFRSVFLPSATPKGVDDWNRESWDPFWSAAEEAGMVLANHIATEPADPASTAGPGIVYRGPGGAVLNYTETSFSGQRCAMKLVMSGVLDRHPNLKLLVAEGGAAWVPYLTDRMIEGYRQHSMMVRPKLTRSVKEIVHQQVYVSFQHDVTAVGTMREFGYTNICWGSDYPHMEGTYGHTQETLHEIFDGAPGEIVHRLTVGAFDELFPTAPPLPADRG